MIYTLASLRAVARSIDERLKDIIEYSDIWIDEKIEHGFEMAEDAVAVFQAEEIYDLTLDIENGFTEVEILLKKEPHYIYLVEINKQYFEYYITGNNHIVVTFKNDVRYCEDKTIKICYFYYPVLPFTEIEMTPEVYHFFKHCLYVNIYGALLDKESEMYHQEHVNKFIKEGTFPLPFGFDTSMQAIKFWNSSWL